MIHFTSRAPQDQPGHRGWPAPQDREGLRAWLESTAVEGAQGLKGCRGCKERRGRWGGMASQGYQEWVGLQDKMAGREREGQLERMVRITKWDSNDMNNI